MLKALTLVVALFATTTATAVRINADEPWKAPPPVRSLEATVVQVHTEVSEKCLKVTAMVVNEASWNWIAPVYLSCMSKEFARLGVVAVKKAEAADLEDGAGF